MKNTLLVAALASLLPLMGGAPHIDKIICSEDVNPKLISSNGLRTSSPLALEFIPEECIEAIDTIPAYGLDVDSVTFVDFVEKKGFAATRDGVTYAAPSQGQPECDDINDLAYDPRTGLLMIDHSEEIMETVAEDIYGYSNDINLSTLAENVVGNIDYGIPVVVATGGSKTYHGHGMVIYGYKEYEYTITSGWLW